MTFWRFSNRIIIIIISTPRLTTRLLVLGVCAMFEGLTRVLLRIYFDLVFVPVSWISRRANRAVTLLLLLADV